MRLIDADALKEELDYRTTKCMESAVAFIKRVIDEQSTVETERKQGKWESIRWSGRIHKCNQCGNMLDFGGVNAGRGDANFCPNCGADMRGGDSNE